MKKVSEKMLVTLAEQHFLNKNLLLAEALVTAALNINPNNDTATEIKADLCYVQNRDKQAAEYYCKTLILRAGV
jgi:Tfp pilus assembly protein PilF